MKFIKTLYLLIIFNPVCFSQQMDCNNDKYWVEIGSGTFATIYDISGIPSFPHYISANYDNGKYLYKLSFLRNEEWDVFGDLPYEKYYTGTVLLGKGISNQDFQVRFYVGIGLTGGITRGNDLNRTSGIYNQKVYERKTFMTGSVPFQVNFDYKPFKYIGFGMLLFADINLVRPYYGIALVLSIGKLRYL
jgi:hypothetical protein